METQEYFGDDLSKSVYEQLRAIAAKMMSSESAAQSMQPTDLVHEALLRLRSYRPPGPTNRAALVKIGTVAMRRLLIEHARRRNRRKKLMSILDTMLDAIEMRYGDAIELDELIGRIRAEQPLAAGVIESRIYLSATFEEIAEAMTLSVKEVRRIAKIAEKFIEDHRK